MHAEFTKALLLRAVPYRDSDVVATLLTPELGVITALARGARKSVKRFGAALDYFQLLNAEVKPSRSGMGALLSVELLHAYSRPAQDYEAYSAACHLIEIARLGVKPGEVSPELFSLLLEAFARIDEGKPPQSVLRLCQVRFLALLGYSLGGGHCVACGTPLEGGASFREGTPHCLPCGSGSGRNLSAGAMKTLSRALSAPLGNLHISTALDRELKPLVEEALVKALGQVPNTFALAGKDD